jgi:hypothetical protein
LSHARSSCLDAKDTRSTKERARDEDVDVS